MCSPEYFGVTYDINPWMSNNIGQVNHALAQQQWNALYTALQSVAKVEVMPGVKNLPDLVFTANAGIVKNNIFVVSKFFRQERQPEEKHFRDWFKNQGYVTFQLDNSYEGEGDHLTDKWNRNWMGHGFRTSKIAAAELIRVIWTKPIPIELVDARWYHLDTCFCPLPNGELLWYPEAFSPASKIFIKNSFKQTIDVSLEDALNFCCNAVPIDNKIFLPKNKEVSVQLENLGYEPHEFDLSEFMKAGGAAKCLVLDLGILPE
jgi:N-dimethylarginine dimethylaminohydrolase